MFWRGGGETSWENSIKIDPDKSRRIYGLIQEKECWCHRWSGEIYGLYKDLSILDDIKI
jgi:hypothetical protein